MASFKRKMKFLDPGWEDKIWAAAAALNNGVGEGWLLPLASLAVTGMRPISLERGVNFSFVRNKENVAYLRANIQGAKLLKNVDGTPRRGQDEIQIYWRLTPPADSSHRPDELALPIKAVEVAPGRVLKIAYDAEGISTRLRDLSQKLWPRKRHHVSAICYRQLMASSCKAAGIPPEQIAMALGHLSTESQGRYAPRPRGGTIAWCSVLKWAHC